MKDLKKYTGDIFGGINRFWFIPKSDVLLIPNPANKRITTAITLKSGKRFYEGFASLESSGFSEPGSFTPNGTIYKPSLSGFIPGDTVDLLSTIEEKEQLEFIVVCKDTDGNQRILGDLVRGLRFRADFDTEKKVAGRKGYSINFASTFTYRSNFYTPSVLDSQEQTIYVLVVNSNNDYLVTENQRKIRVS